MIRRLSGTEIHQKFIQYFDHKLKIQTIITNKQIV